MLRNIQTTHDRLAAKTAGAKKRKRDENNTEADKEQNKKLRKLKKKLIEQQARVQKVASDLYEITSQNQRLEEEVLQAKSRIIRSCIKNRAQIHTVKARVEFVTGRRQMINNYQEDSEKPLKVFSVSAEAYCKLIDGDREDALSKGFPTTTDTGVPDLRDALLAMTWPIRQRNAQSFNEEVESCVTRMKLWSSNTSSEYKMPDEERARLEGRMNTEIGNLDQVSSTSLLCINLSNQVQVFSKLHKETREEILQGIKDGIYRNLPKIAKKAFEIAAKDLVTRDWYILPWNTHRAINKRQGEWTVINKAAKTKVKHDWNEDL